MSQLIHIKKKLFLDKLVGGVELVFMVVYVDLTQSLILDFFLCWMCTIDLRK